MTLLRGPGGGLGMVPSILIGLASVWFFFGVGAVLQSLEGGQHRIVAAFFLDSLAFIFFLFPFAVGAMAAIAVAVYLISNRRPRGPPPSP